MSDWARFYKVIPEGSKTISITKGILTLKYTTTLKKKDNMIKISTLHRLKGPNMYKSTSAESTFSSYDLIEKIRIGKYRISFELDDEAHEKAIHLWLKSL